MKLRPVFIGQTIADKRLILIRVIQVVDVLLKFVLLIVVLLFLLVGQQLLRCVVPLFLELLPSVGSLDGLLLDLVEHRHFALLLFLEVRIELNQLIVDLLRVRRDIVDRSKLRLRWLSVRCCPVNRPFRTLSVLLAETLRTKINITRRV